MRSSRTSSFLIPFIDLTDGLQTDRGSLLRSKTLRTVNMRRLVGVMLLVSVDRQITTQGASPFSLANCYLSVSHPISTQSGQRSMPNEQGTLVVASGDISTQTVGVAPDRWQPPMILRTDV